MVERADEMDELHVAEAMVKGDLPSPQRYGNFFLFDIRITGTGLAYRMGRKEFVWRDTKLYLNERFIKRCNGLPVIWDHPKEAPALNSEEFNARIVGTTFIPYIKNEDVWAIVKIYDDPTIEMMLSEQLSTSPAVVFRKATSTNETVKLDNGETLLIEGLPALLDHIAICEVGVWDKGGPPVGVESIGAFSMAENEKDTAAADKARHDADIKRMDEKFSAMDSKFDAMMDAIMSDRKDRKDAARRDAARKDKFGPRRDGESYKDYSKRHDMELEKMADALRKDSDESEEDCMDAAKAARHDAEENEKRNDKDFEKWAKEEEKEPEHKEDKKDSEDKKESEDEDKKDSTRKDETKEVKERETDDDRKDSQLARDNAELRMRLASLEGSMKRMTAETPAIEIDALASAQSRADGVAAMFGDRAPPPIAGETSLDYRRRMLSRFKRHSDRWKEERFDGYSANTLGLVEDQVYADAVTSAKNVANALPGIVVPTESRDRSGRVITTYHGDISAFLAPFVPSDVQLVKLNLPQRGVL